MNCPKCGAPLRENAAFCTSCGTPVTAPKENTVQAAAPQEQPAAPVQQAPQAPSVYDTFEKTVRQPQPQQAPAYRPAPTPTPIPRPAPVKAEKPKKKSSGGPSKLVPILHKLRAYLAVILAVGCIALLFFPWFRTVLEGEVSVVYDEEKYTPEFGGDETDVSILDVVKFSALSDVVDVRMDDDEFERVLEDNDSNANTFIKDLLVGRDEKGKLNPIDTVKIFGMDLPTGVVAMAPQLLCILLMVIFFIIGVIRTFASEPFPDGAPKTGWLKAGGIVGIVMSVITGAEAFAVNHFFQKLINRFGSEDFDADLEFTLSLLWPYIAFAAASVLIVLLATHWGKKKMKDLPERY